MIAMERLSKAYDGKPVLRDFSLRVEAGEHLCLMGLPMNMWQYRPK